MPAFKIGTEFKGEQDDGQPEEELDARVEEPGAEFLDFVGVGGGRWMVGAAGGDAASNEGAEGEECGGNGGETAGGLVGLQQENPRELLGVSVASFVGGGGGVVVFGSQEIFFGRSFEFDHRPVGVLHFDDDGSAATPVSVALLLPPTKGRRRRRRSHLIHFQTN